MNVKTLKRLLEDVDENAEVVVETNDSGHYRSINPVWIVRGYRDKSGFHEGEDRGKTGDVILWVME